MKKTILTVIAAMGLAIGAHAQATMMLDNSSVGGYLNLNGVAYDGNLSFQVWEKSSGGLLGNLTQSSYNSLGSLGYVLEATVTGHVTGGIMDNAITITMNDLVGHQTSANLVVAAWTGAGTWKGNGGLQEFLGVNFGDNNPATGAPTQPGLLDQGSIQNMGDLNMTAIPAVPEPSTIALGVMGLSALLFRRRK